MRVLEIIIPQADREQVEQILEAEKVEIHWASASGDEELVIKAVAHDEQSKELLLELEKNPTHRVIIYPVEGTMPKLEEKDQTAEERIKLGKFISISKEELYNDIDQPVDLSSNFLLMVILSSIVAGIGILKNNEPILIGAMVIAPFLGPNVSMSFGTTLGDLKIIRKSILTGLVATFIALLISFLWGYLAHQSIIITRDPDIEYRDVILALVCGFAGVIAVVGGRGSTLVGVMVAAALLPPLMRAGLLLGAGNYNSAFNSFLIFSTNIICLNISGIVTFYLAGIRPQRWWEKETAKKKTRRAFLIWLAALLLIVAIIILLRQYKTDTL